MDALRVAIVVDGSLSVAQQAVQAAHAALDWGRLHGLAETTLVLLEAKDETHIRELASRARQSVLFEEPDLGNRVTAAAFVYNRRLLAKLPLALRHSELRRATSAP